LCAGGRSARDRSTGGEYHDVFLLPDSVLAIEDSEYDEYQ
jgi:hypothetical protein